MSRDMSRDRAAASATPSPAVASVMQSKYIDVMRETRALLRVWTDPDTLALLVLELRHTYGLHDDAVRAVLQRLHFVSLGEAMRMAGAHAVVLDYTFFRDETFPSPEGDESNFYYLSQLQGDASKIEVAAKSHWRAADGRFLCYVVSVTVADVSISLCADRRLSELRVVPAQLVTNAASHSQLSQSFVEKLSRLRLAATFNARGDTMHIIDAGATDGYFPSRFGVRIQYEALCST